MIVYLSLNKNHDFDKCNSIVISTSLPVLETKQNELHLTAKVSPEYPIRPNGISDFRKGTKY